MLKRGQITLFMVLGIVILISISAVIYLNTMSKKTPNERLFETSTDILPVKTFVESCLKDTVADGADYLSSQGGYYVVPYNFVDVGGIVNIPYYIDYKEGDIAPDANDLKLQLESYVSDLIISCVRNFSALSQIGLNINIEDSPTADATLNNDRISVKLNFPLQVTKGETITKVTEFITSIEHPLLKLHSIGIETTRLIEKDMEIIPTSDIIDLGIERNVYFLIMDNMNGDVIYSIIDNYNKSDELFFNFATRYLISNENYDAKKIPKIRKIPKLETEPGYEFTYQVEADGEGVVFSDYTSLFDITSGGLISFTPKISDKGTNNVLIKATDSQGREDYEFMVLEIIHDNAPEIENIPDQIVSKGDTFSYQVNASDPDGDLIFYNIKGIPGESINVLNGIVNYLALDSGEKQINVTVVDINGNTATETFVLRVIE